jgi:hypothetical protein
MKLNEVKTLTDMMNDMQRTYKRPEVKPVDPEAQARADAFKATQDAYRDQAQQLVQQYTVDQKEQFLNDIMTQYPGIERQIDLEHVWMFSPAVKAEREKGFKPEDDWKSYQPQPGRNYTGD